MQFGNDRWKGICFQSESITFHFMIDRSFDTGTKRRGLSHRESAVWITPESARQRHLDDHPINGSSLRWEPSAQAHKSNQMHDFNCRMSRHNNVSIYHKGVMLVWISSFWNISSQKINPTAFIWNSTRIDRLSMSMDFVKLHELRKPAWIDAICYCQECDFVHISDDEFKHPISIINLWFL